MNLFGFLRTQNNDCLQALQEDNGNWGQLLIKHH